MNTIELAKKLLGYAVWDEQDKARGYHTSTEFFEALESKASKAMVSLKVFWKDARFNYQWSKGFVTEQDRENYHAFVTELASQVEFLGVNGHRLTISPDAGVTNSALGSSYTYSEPMNFTFILSVEKACELFAALEKHHGSKMIRHISLLQIFDAVVEEDIDSTVESYVEQGKSSIIDSIARVKRGYVIHLPSVTGITIKSMRHDLSSLEKNEITEKLAKKIADTNDKLKQELRDLGVLAIQADNQENVRFLNKTDFKKHYKAADRKRIYSQLPELKVYFEPSKAA